jgi:DNA polymerase-3 subunit epsilon
MNILFYDIETTDLPDWKTPSEAESQPHMIQVAASLVDSERREIVSGINLYVIPEGWTIPEDVTQLTGITTDFARRVGVFEETAANVLYYLWYGCDLRVAHNEQFDARIMRIATKRYLSVEAQDAWKEGAKFCTMRESTNLCAIPQTSGRGKYKFPKLSEAYAHFTGRIMEREHNAWHDMRAAMTVYWAIVDQAAEAKENCRPVGARHGGVE